MKHKEILELGSILGIMTVVLFGIALAAPNDNSDVNEDYILSSNSENEKTCRNGRA